MGVTYKYKPEMCKIALDILSKGESLAAICAELEITRPTLYEWRKNHEEFREAVDIGLQKAQREMEKIGMNGIKGNYDKFSSTPWLFMMRNRFREDYQEDKDSKQVSESIVEKLIDKLKD